MNKRQRIAFKETLVTVFTGLVINWPISIVLLYLFIDVLALSTFTVSILLTVAFSVIAIIRVFTIRMWFTK